MHTLIQISDTHLLAGPRERLRGHCPQASLDTVLAAVRSRTPAADAVIATGDLVHDGSDAGYRRLENALRTLAQTVLALPGNHDDPAAMTQGMRRTLVLRPVIMGNWQIITLNSHVPGRDGGRVAAADLARLDHRLASHPQFAAIAVHHPPVALGSAWIDAIGLANGGELLEILDQHPHARALLFGHAHQSFDRHHNHYRLLGAPSTCRQFRPHSVRFAEDDRCPGYRVVRLRNDGSLSSQVRRAAYPSRSDATNG